MAIKFLKITPEAAVEILEDCMNSGYATIENIRRIYEKQKAITGSPVSPSSEMHDVYNAWHVETFEKISQIFTSNWRQFYFKEVKTNRYAMTSDTVVTPYENNLEVKMGILKEYYDSIMRDSDPKINIGGDLVFQAGENIKYEKQK